MKALLWIIVVILAVFGGYYFGYDNGFEKAVFENKIESDNGVRNADVNQLQTAAENQILGEWQSLEDPRFTREFKSDGSALDLYDNGDSLDKTTLSWSIFSKDNPEASFPYSYENGLLYLSMSNGTEDLYFQIEKITPESLELTYLDRGGVLTFRKVQ